MKWRIKVADRNHKKASDYLSRTSFSGDIYLVMAEMYEEGKEVRKNMESAIKFYQTACVRGDKNAAFRLGTFYENGVGVERNIQTAFQYYLMTAKRKHPDALSALEKLLNAFPHAEREYELVLLTRKVCKQSKTYQRLLDITHLRCDTIIVQLPKMFKICCYAR